MRITVNQATQSSLVSTPGRGFTGIYIYIEREREREREGERERERKRERERVAYIYKLPIVRLSGCYW